MRDHAGGKKEVGLAFNFLERACLLTPVPWLSGSCNSSSLQVSSLSDSNTYGFNILIKHTGQNTEPNSTLFGHKRALYVLDELRKSFTDVVIKWKILRILKVKINKQH